MKIVIYSTPTCPYCKTAKDFFTEQGWEYEEVDVSMDQKKIDEMVEKSGQMGVPVIIISKNVEDKEEIVLVGFNKDDISKAVEEKK